MNIADQLKRDDAAFRELGMKRTLYGFVLENGREYEAAPLPPDIPKMQKKECFNNALSIADDDELVYTEGYGLRPSLGLLIYHAWCVTPDGKVVDPTWDDPETCQYFGIEFQSLWVISLGFTGLALETYANEEMTSAGN